LYVAFKRKASSRAQDGSRNTDRERARHDTRNQGPRQGVKETAMNPESQWIVYRTRFLVRARQLTEPLIFTDAFGREQSGCPGDYLVESSDGMRRVTSRALFEDIYVPLVPAQVDSQVPRVHPAGPTRVRTDGTPSVLPRPVPRASPGDAAGNRTGAIA
jgi:hypothetical protein